VVYQAQPYNRVSTEMVKTQAIIYASCCPSHEWIIRTELVSLSGSQPASPALHSPRSGFARSQDSTRINHCYDSANSGCFLSKQTHDASQKRSFPSLDYTLSHNILYRITVVFFFGLQQFHKNLDERSNFAHDLYRLRTIRRSYQSS
jgi:hypothetical protein